MAAGSFDVTVVDTTLPTVVVPGNIVAEATSAAGATVGYATSVHDVVDGAVTVDCSPASGATFELGATVVSCRATDEAATTPAPPSRSPCRTPPRRP